MKFHEKYIIKAKRTKSELSLITHRIEELAFWKVQYRVYDFDKRLQALHPKINQTYFHPRARARIIKLNVK